MNQHAGRDKDDESAVREQVPGESFWRDRWMFSPPNIPILVVHGALFAWFIFEQSSPGAAFGAVTPSMCFFGLLIFFIVADYMNRLVVCARRRRFDRRLWRWAVTPILIALAILTWKNHWPLEWRFERSRLSFETAARELLKNEATNPETLDEMQANSIFPMFDFYGRQVGSYDVPLVCVFPSDRVILFHTGGFFHSGWGFMYDRSNLRPAFEDIKTKFIAPNWSLFYYAKP